MTFQPVSTLHILTFLKVEHLCKEKKVANQNRRFSSEVLLSCFCSLVSLGLLCKILIFTTSETYGMLFYVIMNWVICQNLIPHVIREICTLWAHAIIIDQFSNQLSNSIFKCYQFEAWQHKLPLYHKSKWLFNKSERLV